VCDVRDVGPARTAYRPLLAYVKSIMGTRDLAQVAWNFINDSLRTTVCLQYSPRYVAAAALSLAVDLLRDNKRVKVELPTLYSSFSVHGTAQAMPDCREWAARSLPSRRLREKHSRTGAPCCRSLSKVCSR